jgi:cytochrome P450
MIFDPKLMITQFYIKQISARSTANGVHCDIAGRMQELRAQKPELKKEWADIMLLHVVGAGFDTLGTTLASCLSFISQTDGCQDRLAEEVSSAMLEGESQHEDLMRLSYLQACIKETLRLKPVVATSLSRTVPMHGLWIGNRLIPGETIVGMNPVVLHRNQEIFGYDVERFRPERWLEASKEQHAKMELYSLAFGSPARSCPGKNLAWMILCRTIADVVQHLSFRILEPDEVMRKGLPAYEEASFFVFKPYNIWAEFVKREDTS